ncbi:GNAT family N-acetyltransferase [Asanoa sp. WMMD1127]|uniref:GNAT family N-acetyltransferase n=1 Tax=Asanoa sp. WMMD1127 TaxID=3016107 RepID=UPI0024160FCE|nr:GNAT family N-acetyltransferase [Asanoa sp. WMMD1127]MDG4824352.1 GNAT family N-acetyltransferase [Asanoa sp. WMMD1127]
MEPVVKDNPGRNRFEIVVDGQDAGFSAYRLRDGAITFTHTQIDPSFEGQGLGSKLARAALDESRARGLRVYAQCPFIAGYIDKHPEYADLLAAD